MKNKNFVWGSIAIGFTLLLILWVFIDTADNRSQFSQVVAGGLYQGMLIFMVAAGLSIVFGLMDVLNFAQGSLLMIGAYVGFDVLNRLSFDTETNAQLLSVHVIALTPILTIVLLEITERLVLPRLTKLNHELTPSKITQKLIIAALIGAPLGYLIGATLTNDMSDAASQIRLLAAVLVTLLVVVDISREILFFALRWVANEISFGFQRSLAIMFYSEAPSHVELQFDQNISKVDRFNQITLGTAAAISAAILAGILNNTDPLILRFGLALVAATFVGAVAGIIMEFFFIRPTYVRPFFQIVLTFGLALVIQEALIYRYESTTKGTLNAYLPPALQGTFPPKFLQGIFANLETSIFNYWIFMIIMGVTMMISVQLLLMRTRIGIIIRAGVQDSEMVEALGVNVRLIFTVVFMIGASIAALGGVISGGFISIDPGLGNLFLLQAIAVVIIGGLGSYAGTALAAIVVGITRSVVAYFSRQQFNTDATAPIAILALMCLVLLIKPSGLFGKEH